MKPLDAAAMDRPCTDPRRRGLLRVGAALAAGGLAGCETLAEWLPTRQAPGAPPPTQATYVFDSGAQMFVMPRGAASFHTFVAPESGLFACSHVIELRDQLIVYDTQLTAALGRELRYYANTLNKRFSRVILSHEHADHWSGWAEFSGIPTFAPRETEAFFTEVAPRLPARPGVVVPKLAGTVAHGDEIVAGVRMETRLQRDAEAASIVTIGFPDQRVWIGGDMVYSRVHPFLGHRQFARWSVLLDQVPEWVRTNALVLPGHGQPTTSAAIAEMKRYLAVAQEAFARYKTADEIEAAIKTQFPDYRGNYYLRFGIDAALKRR
jgi:glyoxylase-like metal-dependent hydrolase (beta-lactamase superfamily II)